MLELGPLLSRVWDVARSALVSLGLPEWGSRAAVMMIQASLIGTLVALLPMVLVYAERKVSAFMQARLGPMEVGPFGILQTIADGIKLMFKEDIIPHGADRVLHVLAPIIAVLPVFACFAPLPYGQGMTLIDLDAGVIWVFALSGITAIGILMGGWSSANKFAMLGGVRGAAQVVSYEIPRVIAVVPILMVYGTQRFQGIAQAQTDRLWGFFPSWFIFYPHPLFPVVGVISFAIFLICSVAETNRVPFDIPEAESELVAGFHTEFSGLKFALFFLAEYAYVFLASAMAVTLFFGGADGFHAGGLLPSWLWFFGKTSVLVFCFFWFRWTFPRLRIDRLMHFCWTFLLPWSIINVGLAGAFILWKGP